MKDVASSTIDRQILNLKINYYIDIIYIFNKINENDYIIFSWNNNSEDY